MVDTGDKKGGGGTFSFWTNLKLWQKIIIALILGVIVGAIVGPEAETYIKPFGSLFINLIKMLIVPLIFLSLVSGVTSMEDVQKMGRVGGKTFALYLATTAIAITIGLVVGTILEPGAGLEFSKEGLTAKSKDAPGFVATLLNMVPRNPVASMADGKVLQIIVFAILFGIALNLSGEKGKPVKELIDSGAEIMYSLTHMVMAYAPYGVFALMAWVAGKFGLSILLPLGKIIAGVYIACLLHIGITLAGLGIILLGRLSPRPYFGGIVDAQAVAFTTTSSSGTLPVTIACAQENLGVSKSVSSFVLPLGATINMDGTAIYQGVAALFVAQAFGIDLTAGQYGVIIVTATLASIGSAGVPGAGLIMLTLVLTTVGLPLEGIAIIAGIDRILDMARTATNVTGDLMVSVLIAKSEGELDVDSYNASAVK